MSERLSPTDRDFVESVDFFDGDAWLDRLYGVGISKTIYRTDGWVKEAKGITEEQFVEFITGKKSHVIRVPAQLLVERLLAMVGS